MDRSKYTIGWLCALPVEMAMAIAVLDKQHADLPQLANDLKRYVYGSIGPHNIVIACLPAGTTGIGAAAAVAAQMLPAFPSLRFGILVGIGGGVPSKDHDIRLGDIVVSQPSGTSGGIVQYDSGKMLQDGNFKRTGSLNRPPQALLAALSILQANHILRRPLILHHISVLLSKYPHLEETASYQGQEKDILFKSEYTHEDENDLECDLCDRKNVIERKQRSSQEPSIFYGIIASGNMVMRDSLTRDRLQREHKILCFEMEAAGLMNEFPCLVVRGICDYADSHKNKRWRQHAAAAAAGYAKELLSVVQPAAVSQTPLASKQIMEQLQEQLSNQISTELHFTRSHETAEHNETRQHFTNELQKLQIDHEQIMVKKLLVSLAFPEINARREEIHEIHAGTYQWIFEDGGEENHYGEWHDFTKWLIEGEDVYWIQGKPGSGKSTLMNYICDDPRTFQALITWSRNRNRHQSSDGSQHVYILTPTFFFWNSGTKMQKSIQGLLRSLIYQLIRAQPQLATSLPQHLHDSATTWTEKKLRDTLEAILKHPERTQNVCFFIDGLDEFNGEAEDLVDLIKSITDFERVKACLSSRPWGTFRSSFQSSPQLRLEEFTYNDISKYVRDKVGDAIDPEDSAGDKQKDFAKLVSDLCHKAEGVFLWTRLTVASLLRGKRNRDSLDDLKARLKALPPELEDMYRHILESVEPVYRKWSKPLFYYASQVYELPPPHLLDYSTVATSMLQLYFLIEPTAGIDRPIQEVLTFFKSEWYERARSLINSASLGLIETVPLPIGSGNLSLSDSNTDLATLLNAHDQLKFSHETVVSFIRDESNQRFLGTTEQQHRWQRDVIASALKAMIWLLRIYNEKIFDSSVVTPRMIDELLRAYALPAMDTSDESNSFEDHEITGLIHVLDQMLSVSFPATPSCLTLAASLSLTSYVQLRVLANQIPGSIYGIDSLTYLLELALTRVRKASTMTTKLFDLTQLLLISGADPNSSIDWISPWKEYLKFLALLFRPWSSTQNYIHSNMENDMLRGCQVVNTEREMMRIIIVYFLMRASLETPIMLHWICWRRSNKSDHDGIEFQATGVMSVELTAWTIIHRIAETEPSLSVLQQLIGEMPKKPFQVKRYTYYMKITHSGGNNGIFYEAWETTDAELFRELEGSLIDFFGVETSENHGQASRKFLRNFEGKIARSKRDLSEKGLVCYTPIATQIRRDGNLEEADQEKILELISDSIDGENPKNDQGEQSYDNEWFDEVLPAGSDNSSTGPGVRFLNGTESRGLL